jgi:hypothetical protein
MRKHPQSAVIKLLMMLLPGVGMMLGSQGKIWGQEPVVIAEWNFDDPVKKEIVDLSGNISDYYPDLGKGIIMVSDGLLLNIQCVEFQLINDTLRCIKESYFATGVTGSAINTKNWQEGSNTKYFLVEFSSENYYNISVFSAQRSSNLGPKNYSLQYSVDNGQTWYTLLDYTVGSPLNFAEGTLSASLPDLADDKSVVMIRWLMRTDDSVNGQTVTSAGTNRIDNIIIRGIPFSHIEYVTPVGGLELDCGSTSEVAALAQLPSTTSILDSEGTSHQVNLSWASIQGYNQNIPGDYTVTASFELPDGISQSDPPTLLEVGTTVTVRSGTIVPEFDAIGPLCEGGEPPALPLASNNLISGTWLPDVINTSVASSSDYTFTPADGQCAIQQTINIEVEERELPVFDQIGPLCKGEAPPTLPETDLDGIPGTWNPSIIKTDVTRDYIFTPDEGYCGEAYIMTIVINPLVIPQFELPVTLCQGVTPPVLEDTDRFGVQGSWVPPVIDTQMIGLGFYVFTPDDGQCADILTVQIDIQQTVQTEFAEFDFIGTHFVCESQTPFMLPEVSDNGIQGEWWPVSITSSGQYYFTPEPGHCGTPVSLTVEVIPDRIAVFDPIGPYCQYAIADPLPSRSQNGIIGTWDPPIIDTSVPGTLPYTFTPSLGQCASVTVIDVNVEERLTPIFSSFGPYCQNANSAILLPKSQNGITGTWDPSIIETSEPGIWPYTFTPSLDQCAWELNREIEIKALPDTPVIDSIIYPECGQATYRIFFSGLPEGNWILFPLQIHGSGSTYILSGETPINFLFSVEYGQCRSGYTRRVEIISSTLPAVDLGEPITVDFGDPITLTATVSGAGPFNYLWTPEDVFAPGEHNTETPTTLPLQSTTLVTLTVTDANGCSSSDQLQITVEGGSLQAHASADRDVLCYGDQVQLFSNVSGGAGEPMISWASVPPGFVSDEANSVDIPLQTTTYILVVTDGLKTVTSTTTVQVNPRPMVSCPVGFSVCSNQDAFEITGALVDGAAVEGGYYMLDGTEIAEFDPAEYDSGYDYQIWYHYTNIFECAATCSFVITLNEAPLVYAGEDRNDVAYGTSIALDDATAPGDAIYHWSPEDVFEDHTMLNPTTLVLTEPGLVTLTVTDANGCSSSDQLQITVDGGPLQAQAIASHTVLCSGEQVQLFSNVSGGAGYPVISWTSDPPGFESNEANPVDVPSETTTYFLVVTDGIDTRESSVEVKVNPMPVLSCPESLSVCSNDDAFEITSALVDGVAIEGGYYMLDGDEITVYDPAAYASGIAYPIWYHFMSSDGCEATCSFTITLNEAPVVDAGSDVVVDYGTSVTLDEAVASGTTDLLYHWRPEDIFEDHTVIHPTTISLTENVLVFLTVTDANGCSSSDQLQIIVEGGPLSAQPVAEPETVCAGEPVQLFAHVAGGLGEYSYSWISDTNEEAYTIENPVVYPTTNTIYQLRVTDELGDIAEESVSVTVHPNPVVTCPSSRTVALNVAPFDLVGGTPAGGTYYLNEMPVTQFVPDQAGVGLHSIDYIYRDGNSCESFCSFNIEVVVEQPRYLPVTFNVDMSFAPKYKPGVDKVYITGSMFNFAVPGALPDKQMLLPTDNQMLFTQTIELPVGRYYYKYFLNEGWAGEEWPSAPIRIADISRNTSNVFNDYFGRPDDPTSVSYLSTQIINIFPNPVQYTLHITSEGDEPLQQIRIINMLGQTVHAEHIDHLSSYRIDINNLPPGLYVVQVHCFTGWHSTKVQVVR